MERFKHYGRDIFDGEHLAAQTVARDQTLFNSAQAVGFAGRIVQILNMTNGLPLEVIKERLSRS